MRGRRSPGRERHEPQLRLLRRQQQSGPESADAATTVAPPQTPPPNNTMKAPPLHPPPPALTPFTATGTIGFTGTARLPGYSMGAGTGYNPGGFVFITYSVVGSGTGPRSTTRQIDVQAAYGPVAQ